MYKGIENITICNHPLIKHKLSIVRQKTTGTNEFRTIIEEISMMIGYEALRNLSLEDVEIETPVETAMCPFVAGKKPAVVPILRAGLGMVGGMLKEFGCVNIADSDGSLLTELSLEAIVQSDPDYIFISCMGDLAEGQAQLEASLTSNPIWDTLQAVENNRVFWLDKELFHQKPNARWGESYEILAELLSQ